MRSSRVKRAAAHFLALAASPGFMMSRHLLSLVSAALLALAGVSAYAQTETPAAAPAAPAAAAPAAPAAAPAPARPAPAAPARAAAPAPAQQANPQDLTVNEMVGDWTIRCFRVQAIAPCDMLQVALQQNIQPARRVLLVSIAYVPRNDAYVMQIVVPLGVAVPKGLNLAAGTASLNGMKFNRCERDGCYVEGPVPAATIQALAAAGAKSSVTITAYQENRTATLPVSLTGFADALNRLRMHARDKAVNVPGQTAP
jgi:invasion protein IalB